MTVFSAAFVGVDEKATGRAAEHACAILLSIRGSCFPADFETRRRASTVITRFVAMMDGKKGKQMKNVVVDLDADLASADWTKATWDLPPYKSPEFFEQMGATEDLEMFRRLPIYEAAVHNGLIRDDQWTDCDRG